MTNQEKLGKIFELMNDAEGLIGLDSVENILILEYYSDYSGSVYDAFGDEIIGFENLDEAIEKLTEYVNSLKVPAQAEEIDELQQHNMVLKSVNEGLEKRVEELKAEVERLGEITVTAQLVYVPDSKMKAKTIKDFTDAEIQKEYENRFFLDCAAHTGGE